MALVHNKKDSLFGGVNQQSAEFRQSTQVEEMINAMPTINQGLLKRNPTVRKTLDKDINFTDEIWTYEYQRGFADGDDEKYAINITNEGGMEIINVNTGKVYNEVDGLTFDAQTRDYLFPFIGANGYAATTIKDTTFFVNKNRTPILDNKENDVGATPVAKTYKYILQQIIDSPNRSWVQHYSSGASVSDLNAAYPQRNYAPSKVGMWEDRYGDDRNRTFVSYGSRTTVLVDGISIIVDVPRNSTETAIGYYSRLEKEIRLSLDPNLYSVERAHGYGSISTLYPPIRITRWDESLVSASINISMNAQSSGLPAYYYLMSSLDSVEADYIGAITSHDWITTYTPPKIDYLKNGFIWIKRSDPASVGYTYTYSVVDSLANSVSGSVTNTTTDGAATAIAALIDADVNFSAQSVGSVIRIVADATDAIIERVDAGDSYGNQASYGWAQEATVSSDLPKNLGFDGSIVHVIGTSDNSFATYWLTYSSGQWRETVDPSSLVRIDKTSMPHILIRNADDTFTFKSFDEWDDKKVGDDLSNKPASFLSTVNNVSPVIKDIFFFKNRLGFITSRTVVMSEVGEYGNFWRTTVAALLDSDRIDAAVDTTKAIELEYATYLEDSVMLFADIQFRLQGGSVLSPTNVQISQTSAYELNRNVRPVFMNDRIFFCVKRGQHTAVMEYFVSESASSKSEANDITAHCQTYIPSDVIKISGSAINNMLFIKCKSEPSLIYVYKYYDSGNQRVQAAWFKWEFNGTLYNAFSFGNKVNIMISRLENTAIENWVLGTGVWDMSNVWDNSKLWVMSPDSLISSNQFEEMQIAPLDFIDTDFIDDNRLEEDVDSVSSYYMSDTVVSGQILSRKDFKIYMDIEAEIRFFNNITSGEIEYKVVISDGTIYSFTVTSTDLDNLSVTIPIHTARHISEIQIVPKYNVLVEGAISFPEIYQANIEGNLLPKMDNYGWYVDDVSIPVDGAIVNLGSWFKGFDEKQVGSVVQSLISIGEWVMEFGDKKETRGHLKFKTVQVNSDDGSDFSLLVEDVKRNTIREIKSKYTVDRKPMVYGDAKNIRVHIANNTDSGFRINTVSFEGSFNIRSRRS